MPPIPLDQVSPYGPPCDRTERIEQPDVRCRDTATGELNRYPRGPPDPPHLTMKELAERWRRTPKTIERHYQQWGLIPLRFGGRLLFPIEQVLEVERRAMVGQLVIGRGAKEADRAERPRVNLKEV